MPEPLGTELERFAQALDRFREALGSAPELRRALFAGSEEWTGLLSYKLLPHLAGEGCLVVAVAGGTNTGKSTVFNILVGQTTSPVRTTAAATCRPVLAGNAKRAQQALDALLLPEFKPTPLQDAESIVRRDSVEDTLYVTENAALPDTLVVLDTPDVDSIDLTNWTVADNIRATGDVLIAILTAEKYKDERVVAYFREAHAAGRIVLPLMNKADPANAYASAVSQLEEFRKDVGLGDAASFVAPHDFSFGEDPASTTIASATGGAPLRAHLNGLDVGEIKQRVFRDTVTHFLAEAETFLDKAATTQRKLEEVAVDFDGRIEGYAERYDPAPGAAVGGLFHEFVQKKRSGLGRAIGTASTSVARGVGAVGRAARRAMFPSPETDAEAAAPDADQLHSRHAQALERHTRDLVTSWIETARRTEGPAGDLLRAPIDALDVDVAVPKIVAATLRAENISDEFRAHAERTLEEWWEKHPGRRRAIEALDRVLLIMPAAIAAPMSIYTAGVGVPEVMTVAGPLVEQFVARVVEYQFGDAMFDFLSPWRAEQRAAFAAALRTHVAEPVLQPLREAAAPFAGTPLQELREAHDACRKALLS